MSEKILSGPKSLQIVADEILESIKLTILNYDVVWDGKDERREGRKAAAIWADLKHACDNRIKRIKNRVFANGAGKIVYFDRADDLVGWCAAQGLMFDWSKGNGCISKPEFLKFISNVADEYAFATALPHYPKVKGFYYINDIAPANNGRLDELMGFFKPYTWEDNSKLRSAFQTPFWGGSFGSRPAFLIDGIADDKDGNRGIGKTAVTDTISYLCDGHIDLSTKTEGPEIRKMLLTGGDLRIVRFDNIKANTLSSDTIESLITAQKVSGHRMYIGHDSIPNWFGYYLTFNDAMLSKDMAQRAIIIRLSRPDYDPEWWHNVITFIDKYRVEIIADIGQSLLKAGEKFIPKSRFPLWERNVLSKCTDNIEELQKHIINDSATVDDAEALKEDVTEMILEKLSSCTGMDPRKAFIAVKRSWVTNWLQDFLGKNYSKKSALKLLRRILPDNFLSETKLYLGVHYLIWTGDNSGNSGASHTPKAAWRISSDGKGFGKVEWKLDSGVPISTPKKGYTPDDTPDESLDDIDF